MSPDAAPEYTLPSAAMNRVMSLVSVDEPGQDPMCTVSP